MCAFHLWQPAFWQTRSVGAWLLWPLSFPYGMGRWVHRRLRLLNRYWPSVPVISVGNITVGGGGKTPFVSWLAQHYALRGESVAIVMRGYGGRMTDPYRVQASDTFETVGDEAVMLLQQLSPLPVSLWVGRNRKAVVQRAEQAGATLIILDDGFQRDDIARAVNIVCLDGHGNAPFGNGFCLPAGPLREPLSALQRAHFAVLFNSADPQPRYVHVPAYRLRSHVHTPALDAFIGKPVVAFSGIARPEKFFASLAAAGVILAATERYPDHHVYTAADLATLKQRGKAHKAALLTTEKDKVKLPKGFAHAIPLVLKGEDKENILAEIGLLLR